RPPLRRAVGRVVGSGLLGAATTPGRLLRVEAVLVVAALVLGVLGVLGGMARVSAVHDARTRIAALTTGAADLYQSLADADAMATTGYVSGGLEPATVRARYDDDIQRAGRLLTNAAGLLPPGDPAIAAVSTVGEQLPVYTGLVENARTLNRLGLPLGQSYLASASKLMQSTILPAVEQVRRAESAALDAAYRQGAGTPFAVLAMGLAVLLGLLDLALRERRRTNRVINVGLLAGGLAVLVFVGWWGTAALVAHARVGGAQSHSDAGAALDEARIAVLSARSNESLVLVARNSGGGSSDRGFGVQLARVVDADGLLAAAERADPDLADRVAVLRSAAVAWDAAHRGVRALDDGGRYPEAVASVVGHSPDTSGGAFDSLDAALAEAIRQERAEYAVDIGSAEGTLVALPWVSAVLALVAAAAVVTGIGRRVGEYR
ncbi:MAG TPA: hypothetical protein VJT79_01060, partial [Pseudonocardia sp.]|nr:hypothetical protein [Pseudonocardia sp.]